MSQLHRLSRQCCTVKASMLFNNASMCPV